MPAWVLKITVRKKKKKVKIDKDALEVQVEEELKDVDISELQDKIGESSPRFILYSFKWARDGRFQYPIVFIHFSPTSANVTHHMLYTRMKSPLIKDFTIQRVCLALLVQKIFLFINKKKNFLFFRLQAYELRDIEELNHDWVLERINKA